MPVMKAASRCDATLPDGPLTTHYSLLTTHYSLLTTHYSLLTTHYSLLTTHYSLLTTHYSPLTTHHSPLTTHHSPLTTRSPHPTQMRRTELSKLCTIADGLFLNGQWLHIYPEVHLVREFPSLTSLLTHSLPYSLSLYPT